MKKNYKRIILKISGEILGSRTEGEPNHAQSLENICREIKAVADMGSRIYGTQAQQHGKVRQS